MDFLFPHDKPRKVQNAFMNQVFVSIQNKQNLLVHAPTGTGKTSSVLSPALSFALKSNKTIFFLTSRHTQHLIAIDTLLMIKKKFDKKINVVDLIGKKWMCNQPNVNILTSGEFSEYCKELKEKNRCLYYQKMKSKGKPSFEVKTVLSELKQRSPLHVEEVVELCEKYSVCPYEISCLFGKEAQVIIADYNHLINPHIREALLKKIDKKMSDIIVIIDEAHNLPQRARNELTSNLSSFILDQAIKEARKLEDEEIVNEMVIIRDAIASLVKDKIVINKTEALVTKEEFFNLLKELGDLDEVIARFAHAAEKILEVKKRSFIASVATFLEVWKGTDEGFARIISRDFNKLGKVVNTLSYRCLDPSILISDLANSSHNFISMSGTLTPTIMYQDLFGLNEKNTIRVEYENPFPKENRLNIIVPRTTTKFTLRNEKMYEDIAEHCAKIINNVPGNSAIFFPSYKIMKNVFAYLKDKSKKTIFLEESGVTKEAKSELIELFKSYKDTGAVLLGTSAGSLGEGIDLPGDLLKAVIVVGLPLGKPDLETEQLIAYFDHKYGKGWDYGYIIPALIRCFQNAGRCIRSETDKGIIVFLDERYVWKNYFKCFPNEWNVRTIANPKTIIQNFFNRNS